MRLPASQPAAARTFCPLQTLPLATIACSACPACRSVSADPSLHEECFKGAKFLLRLLESIGCEVKLSQVGGRGGQPACLQRACLS